MSQPYNSPKLSPSVSLRARDGIARSYEKLRTRQGKGKEEKKGDQDRKVAATQDEKTKRDEDWRRQSEATLF